IQPSANYWWWEINGDSLFYNTLPGPVNAGSNNTVTYKCIANYGNNNCEVVEEKMVVTKPLTYYDEHQLICLPNPANNEVILMHTENIIYGNLSIYDISGAIVKEIIISDAFSSFYKISISDLSAGLYVIALMDNNEVLTTSLIVTH
nr:T9SS type A sorting domain-containing protein [Chitinophagales bacterium]